MGCKIYENIGGVWLFVAQWKTCGNNSHIFLLLVKGELEPYDHTHATTDA